MRTLWASVLAALAAICGCRPAASSSGWRLRPAPGKADLQGAGPVAGAPIPAAPIQWPSLLPAARGAAVSPTIRLARAAELPRDSTWVNTSGPIRLRDLRGKFVLLDFWTYCCINCFHVLPELKKLEQAYPNELVVIGVHSAKFATERAAENIEEAIQRYDVEHPVVNDANHRIWNAYGVQVWPTLVLIDPLGLILWRHAGEITFEQLDALLKRALPAYQSRKLLDRSPVRFERASRQGTRTALRFPGKVLADESSNRLFVADSNHNRIVVAALDGRLLATIGSGRIGRADGDFATASFHHPQGMAIRGDSLYVADTENHLLRRVDLRAGRVATIAGTGRQARAARAGAGRRGASAPKTTALSSPWALSIHADRLYIAMAGCHQIWWMSLDESQIGPYAGNGVEDIVDGALLPRRLYELGFCSFAQPSGLASDGQWLFVADSEGSSIRAVPLDPTGKVRTVVGTAGSSGARLFTFGDRDGARGDVRLQHPLGIAHHAGKLFVADTYNNKIKVIDARTGQTRTLAGGLTEAPGAAERSLNEPSGVSFAGGRLYAADTNNHRIVVIDPETGRGRVLPIASLQPPPAAAASAASLPFPNGPVVRVRPTAVRPINGQVRLVIQLVLASGWKISPNAPMRLLLEAASEKGLLDRSSLGVREVDKPSPRLEIQVPVRGEGEENLKVSLAYYVCQAGGEGICRGGSVVWTVPLRITTRSPSDWVGLQQVIGGARR